MCWICGLHGLDCCIMSNHFSEYNVYGCPGNQFWDVRNESLCSVACEKWRLAFCMPILAPYKMMKYCICKVYDKMKSINDTASTGVKILMAAITLFWILPFVLALVGGLIFGMMITQSAARVQGDRCWIVCFSRTNFIHKRGRQSMLCCCCICDHKCLCGGCCGFCGKICGCGE